MVKDCELDGFVTLTSTIKVPPTVLDVFELVPETLTVSGLTNTMVPVDEDAEPPE